MAHAKHQFCVSCPVGGDDNEALQTCSVPDPTDGLPVACGGEWAQEKHARIRKYVDISRATRRKFISGAGGACYIDLFCGPGRARVRGRAAKSPLDKFAPGWRAAIDEKRRDDVIRASILMYWLTLIRNCGMQTAEGVEEVTGTRNQHLYWLVFVARHALALQFWDEIRSVTQQRDLPFWEFSNDNDE